MVRTKSNHKSGNNNLLGRVHFKISYDKQAQTLSVIIIECQVFLNSVWDPDPVPDPQDPHVFGPPGSGSISQMYGSGFGLPFSHKRVKRTEIMPAK